MRFVVETYEAARGAVGSAIAVGIRLSGDEHLEGGIGHEELKTVVKTLGGLGIDYLHMSDGSDQALKHFFPASDATMLDEAVSFKSVLPPSVPVICVSIHNPERSSKAIREGKIDMVSLGRQTPADPDYANKVRAGQPYTRCLRCCQCLLRTAAGLTVRCPVNPDLGRERFLPSTGGPPASRSAPRSMCCPKPSRFLTRGRLAGGRAGYTPRLPLMAGLIPAIPLMAGMRPGENEAAWHAPPGFPG